MIALIIALLLPLASAIVLGMEWYPTFGLYTTRIGGNTGYNTAPFYNQINLKAEAWETEPIYGLHDTQRKMKATEYITADEYPAGATYAYIQFDLDIDVDEIHDSSGTAWILCQWHCWQKHSGFWSRWKYMGGGSRMVMANKNEHIHTPNSPDHVHVGDTFKIEWTARAYAYAPNNGAPYDNWGYVQGEVDIFNAQVVIP